MVHKGRSHTQWYTNTQHGVKSNKNVKVDLCYYRNIYIYIYTYIHIYTHTYLYLYTQIYKYLYIYILDSLHCMKFTGMHCMVFFFFLLHFCCCCFLFDWCLEERSCEPRGLMFESRSRPQAAVSQLVHLFGQQKRLTALLCISSPSSMSIVLLFPSSFSRRGINSSLSQCVIQLSRCRLSSRRTQF
ncbi:hypothetical protein KUCAC02_030319 [Chaenocephalus aceratus]|uniref:Uncharacterized protein n=1 Tax=Chaenocephalus aceratus TaxID=36190 RepID=A0ACB9XKG3_CHAAC|nr:hypothetical protein KUCAC02_030319 [Chaenocephalus aceratus]